MNTDNNRKAMADAKAKTEAGVKQKMRKKPSEWKRKSEESSEQSNQGMTEGGEWEVYDFQIRGGSLKNYNPQGRFYLQKESLILYLVQSKSRI